MNNEFKPALRYSFLNRFYDRLATWAFRKTSFMQAIKQVIREISPCDKAESFSLLELGCGPGRLAIQMKKSCPQLEITAVDRDPDMINLARANAQSAAIEINFLEQDLLGMKLPTQFDRVYSTLVFHHLSTEAKIKVLNGIRELLNPSGKFVLADFSAARKWVDRLKFFMIQLIDGFTTTAPHHQGWLEQNLKNYFPHVEEKSKVSTLFGPVSVFVCSLD